MHECALYSILQTKSEITFVWNYFWKKMAFHNIFNQKKLTVILSTINDIS